MALKCSSLFLGILFSQWNIVSNIVFKYENRLSELCDKCIIFIFDTRIIFASASSKVILDVLDPLDLQVVKLISV